MVLAKNCSTYSDLEDTIWKVRLAAFGLMAVQGLSGVGWLGVMCCIFCIVEVIGPAT